MNYSFGRNLEQNEQTPCYRVEECPKLGRYIVATRDLCKGEIIFQEYPLAAAPQKNSTLICPGCFTTPVLAECLKCHWPICETECPRIENHKWECQAIQEVDAKNFDGKNRKRSVEEWITVQDTLMIFRCLILKFTHPEKWNYLNEMESLWHQWSKSPLYSNAQELVIRLREDYGISELKFDDKEIYRVLAIFDINAYEVKMPGINIQGCYKLASLAEHCCIPNAFKTTSSERLQTEMTSSALTLILGSSLLLTMRALTFIPKNAHITTTYCDILWPTNLRQRHNQWSKFFVCECLRCTDKTELGSYTSSFLCPDCPALTPLTPNLSQGNDDVNKKGEETSPEPIWRFTSKNYECCKCGSVFPAARCESFLLLAEKQLQEIDKQCASEEKNVMDFESWLEQWTVFPAAKIPMNSSSQNPSESESTCKVKKYVSFEKGIMFLHPQHFLCVDACHTTFLLYSTESTSMENLLRKNALGMHLLQATANLFQGISMFRGTVMYELAMTKAAILSMYLDDIESQSSNDNTHIHTLGKEIVLLLTESLDHLRFECQDQPEGQLFSIGLKQLEEFNCFLKDIVMDL